MEEVHLCIRQPSRKSIRIRAAPGPAHVNTHGGPVNKTNTHHTLLEETPAESIAGSIIGSVGVLMKPRLAGGRGVREKKEQRADKWPSLVNSCPVNQICGLFGRRGAGANAVSACWMWLTLSVPARCGQMVDPAPSPPSGSNPHYGSATVTRNSQARRRHQEPPAALSSSLLFSLRGVE